MLLALLMVLVMACLVFAALHAHSIRQSAVRVRVEKDPAPHRRDLR